MIRCKEMRGPLDKYIDLFGIDLELFVFDLMRDLLLPQLHLHLIILYIASPANIRLTGMPTLL